MKAEQKDDSYKLKLGSMYSNTLRATVWLTCITSSAANLIEEDGKWSQIHVEASVSSMTCIIEY